MKWEASLVVWWHHPFDLLCHKELKGLVSLASTCTLCLAQLAIVVHQSDGISSMNLMKRALFSLLAIAMDILICWSNLSNLSCYWNRCFAILPARYKISMCFSVATAVWQTLSGWYNTVHIKKNIFDDVFTFLLHKLLMLRIYTSWHKRSNELVTKLPAWGTTYGAEELMYCK